MLRQAHYPRMVFRISRTTTVRRSPLPDVVADAYADVPPGGVVCTGLHRAMARLAAIACNQQSAPRTAAGLMHCIYAAIFVFDAARQFFFLNELCHIKFPIFVFVRI